MLSQKLSTSVKKTSKTLGRFLPQEIWNEPKYEDLASAKHLLEREIDTRFLVPGIFCPAFMLSAKSAIPLILYFERAEMLISIPEAARDYLHVSRSTVYRLADEGAIQIVHVRGSARIPLKSIQEYVESLCGGHR